MVGRDRQQTDAVTLLRVPTPAADQVRTGLAAQGQPEAALRVFIAGPGRNGAGFQYGLALSDGPDGDDLVVEVAVAEGSVRFVVDLVSAPFLNGALVDYVDTGL